MGIALEIFHIAEVVTVFQRRRLVGLVGHLGGGCDDSLQRRGYGRGAGTIPAGVVPTTVRVVNACLHLSIVAPVSAASFPPGWFQSVMSARVIEVLIMDGHSVVMRSIQTEGVGIDGRTCQIFVKRWVRAGAYKGGNSKLIAAWPGYVDPCIGALWVWRQLVLLEAGQIIRCFVEVSVLH